MNCSRLHGQWPTTSNQRKPIFVHIYVINLSQRSHILILSVFHAQSVRSTYVSLICTCLCVCSVKYEVIRRSTSWKNCIYVMRGSRNIFPRDYYVNLTGLFSVTLQGEVIKFEIYRPSLLDPRLICLEGRMLIIHTTTNLK